MTPPAALDGNVSDLLAMFRETFPGWRVACTEAGWWATRGSLTREDLAPEATLRASTPAGLLVLLQDAT